MRPVALALLIGGLLAAPSFADIGSISLFISSTDDNGPLDSNPAVGAINYFGGVVPATIPIEIGFSATASGPDGPNGGVMGVAFDVAGSALVGIGQVSLTPDATFTSTAFVGGLGFDFLTGGVGAGGVGGIGVIAGIGEAQALPGNWSPVQDAANVGHRGNVTVASGLVNTNGMEGQIDVGGNANLWDAANLATFSSGTFNVSSLFITAIVPEPACLLLLAFGALPLGMLRRRPE